MYRMSIFVWFLPAFYGIGWGKFVVLSVCLLCPGFLFVLFIDFGTVDINDGTVECR